MAIFQPLFEALESGGVRTESEPADWGTWESARGRKLVAALEATPAQRLAWLEDAIRFAFQTGALPKRLNDRG